MNPLRRQLYHASLYKHSRGSLLESGVVSLTWDGSQVGLENPAILNKQTKKEYAFHIIDISLVMAVGIYKKCDVRN